MKLKALLSQHNITIKQLAEKIDVSAYHCGQKLNNNRFTVKEVNIILKMFKDLKVKVKYEHIFLDEVS